MFIDVDSISPGVDFEEKITNALNLCQVAFILIGNKWLTQTRSDGTRRLDDKRDFVRKEVALALERPGVAVVPVLVEGAGMPDQDELPPDMARLSRLNAVDLSNKRWQSDFNQLSQLAARRDTWWHRLPRWAKIGVPALAALVAAVVVLVTVLVTSGSSPWRACDPNISAFTQKTSCPFAENTFYEFWKATGGKPTPGARTVHVWSPVSGSEYVQSCTDRAGGVYCTHNNGDGVRFSQASVIAYTPAEAKAFAKSSTLGPHGR